ncbi:MAG: OB-fold domain-containing protein, partial [Proteobacteria bacterium]|nr:OB-fold domain-containing protein [Pseudomonadota bacterium]
RSDQEQLFGDAGAAVLVGGGDAPVAYLGGYAVTDEITDVWRTQEDTYVQSWEGRFVTGEGYLRVTAQAVKGLMSQMGLKPEDIAKAIIPAPDPRSGMGILKKTGLSQAGEAVDSQLEQVGFCGAAHPLVMLAAVLEQAQPGEKILVAAYGDGAQALLFEVKAQPVLPAVSLAQQLENRRAINSYARFLSFNGLVEPQPGEPFRLVPSATVTWRERDSLLRCRGSKCQACGTAAFPIQRICDNCRSVDQFETVRLSGMAGEVFTFSRDNLAGRPDDPVVVQTVVQMENGARFYGLMTDADPTQVELGTPVRLTLRRMHDLGGFHNYFWKCRPVR